MNETIEPTIHIIDFDKHGTTLCHTAVIGDMAITKEQALDQTNALYFNCKACLEVLTKEYYAD